MNNQNKELTTEVETFFDQITSTSSNAERNLFATNISKIQPNFT